MWYDAFVHKLQVFDGAMERQGVFRLRGAFEHTYIMVEQANVTKLPTQMFI